MSPNERRAGILRILQEAASPVPGDDLGERFGVGRTAVCADVAVLRAEGHKVIATPRGYVLEDGGAGGYRDVVKVRHDETGVEDELCALVDAGVTVADVVVDHPVYGELRGTLQIRGRDEVAAFVGDIAAGRTRLLSSLTGGVHSHTLWAADPARLERAREKLRALGILIDDDVTERRKVGAR